MTNLPNIDVSVIIPAWRAEDTIERAVRSGLAQDGVSVEVIVVDDASPDGTLARAQSLAEEDPRVRVISQAQNAGPAAARNRALEVARGDYVTPLDSDDFMLPGRLATLLEIARSEEWDFVADDLWKVEAQNIDGPRARLWSEEPIGTLTLTTTSFVEGNLSSRHGGRGELGFLKPLMRRRFLSDNDLTYLESMRLGEDYMLYTSALLAGARFCMVDPAGYVAVVRADSLSGQHSARELEAFVDADLDLLEREALAPSERQAIRTHYIETLKVRQWLRLIDAVKARNIGAALACFATPLPVITSLLGHLFEQVWLRGPKRLFSAKQKAT